MLPQVELQQNSAARRWELVASLCCWVPPPASNKRNCHKSQRHTVRDFVTNFSFLVSPFCLFYAMKRKLHIVLHYY